MKFLKSLVVCIALAAPLAACATPSIAQSVAIAEQAFTAAQVLYNTVCAMNAGASFCSGKDMQLANAAADTVRHAIETYDNVSTAKGLTDAQVQAAITGVVTTVRDFERIINVLQAKKAKYMAAHAPN